MKIPMYIRPDEVQRTVMYNFDIPSNAKVVSIEGIIEKINECIESFNDEITKEIELESVNEFIDCACQY